MNFKIGEFFLFLLLAINLNTAQSAAKILISRHENWSHPVEAIFKKYELTLYKVHYSKDGTCPTFYLRFKYPPLNTQKTIDYPKVYSEILQANANYPYALVDEADNLKINVGWNDKAKKSINIKINKAATLSMCQGNEHAHIDDGADFDKFTITEDLKKRILSSPYKASLRKNDGTNFVAYLYAENISQKPKEYYNDKNNEMVKVIGQVGNYYLYLYDVSRKSFFPGRVEIFKDNYKNIMGVPGAEFFSLPTATKNKSDILLVGQHGFFEDSFYEAYGFTENHLFLKKYVFLNKQKQEQFTGKINKILEQGKFIAYEDVSSEMKKMYLSLSEISGEIELRPATN